MADAPAPAALDEGKDAEPPPAPPASPWMAASERIRSTATWITKAFVAVGAVLVGSTPILYRFGDLELSTRTVVAGIAGVVALVAVGVVIYAASEVARPAVAPVAELLQASDDSPLGRLRHEVEGSPAARALSLKGAGSIQDLLQRREEHREAAARMDVLAANATTPAARTAFEELAKENIDAAGVYDAALADLAERASYTLLEHRFVRSRGTALAAGGVIAVSLAIWVGGLQIGLVADEEHAKEDKAEQASEASSAGSLALVTWLTEPTKADEASTETIDALRTSLGLDAAACDQMDALVIDGKGTTDDPWNLELAYGADGCQPGAKVRLDARFVALTEPAAAKTVTVKGIPPTKAEDDDEGPAIVALSAVALALIGAFVFAIRRPRPMSDDR